MSARILQFRPYPVGRDKRAKHTGKTVCLYFPHKQEREYDHHNNYSIPGFFPPAA